MRKIFGHRGLPHIYEENTFKSLNKAQEICDFVETDVRITKDQELVLYHDADIETKKIEELTLSDIDELIDVEISEIHLISREQIKGDTNFELKISSTNDDLNKVFIKKMINLTDSGDIISSFNWEIILNNRKSFKSEYGILIDKENQLFESKAMSNLDEKLMFMVEKEIFYSRNFDLPLERCVVWTVNDKDEIDHVLNMNVYGVVTDIGDKL
ncbi:glycerophosphodiester phosphodiesterase [Acidimicrobiaceae bacterium]|nr:glycerophosphodiester phosphodiesterase [Acidimicrobiaceae bacterium]